VDKGTGGKKDKVSIPDWWKDANKVKLDALKNAPIEMGNTAYG
jgi:hypothetical protein